MIACSSPQTKKAGSPAAFIDEAVISAAVDSVKSAYPSADAILLEKGVRHAASLWRAEDGTSSEFSDLLRITTLRIRETQGCFQKDKRIF